MYFIVFSSLHTLIMDQHYNYKLPIKHYNYKMPSEILHLTSVDLDVKFVYLSKFARLF